MRLRNVLVLLAILLALGGYYYYSSRPEPAPKPESTVFVWLIEMDDIQQIEIQLPDEGKSQVFVQETDRTWHFADPQRSPVDMQRWGGGIPLLLSGPGAARVISENTTAEKLAEFGLTQPRMKIVLTLKNERSLNITVGDSTPDGVNYYVQAPGSNAVALVDYTWYQVLARLVTEPPYASLTTR